MKGKSDPLSELFSNVELTGLSNTRNHSSKESPLLFDLPDPVETTEVSAVQSTERKMPVRPPRLGPNESFESDVEIEEFSSEDDGSNDNISVAEISESSLQDADSFEQSEPEKPVVDVQEMIRRKKAQLEVEAKKKAILARLNQKASTTENETPIDSSQTSTSSVAERFSQMDASKKNAPSALDLFAAEAKKSKQKKAEPLPSSVNTTNAAVSTSSSTKTTTSENDTAISNQPIMGNRLILAVEAMIKSHLPGLKKFHVASALDSFDRRVLTAIWGRYRMQFLLSGQLEYAVAALSVVDALDSVEEGQLVAAYVETTASDYLIWVNLSHGRLVAAFADAGRYFAS